VAWVVVPIGLLGTIGLFNFGPGTMGIGSEFNKTISESTNRLGIRFVPLTDP
jgi:hypothetical protein